MLIMRFFTVVFFVTIIWSQAGMAQFVVEQAAATSNNNENEYTIYTPQGEAVSIQKYPGSIEFLSAGYTVAGFEQMSISPGKNMFAFLHRQNNAYRAEVFQENGQKVNIVEEIDTYDPDDPSPKVYVLDNGEMYYRYNVSFFYHYDSNGERLRTINNSSGSHHGEKISNLKVMPNSNAVLIYNDRILYGGDWVGSRLRYYDGSGDPQTIYRSESLYINGISFSPNGQLILLHLVNERTGNHYARAIDTNGNTLHSLEYDGFEPVELSVGNNGRYLTSRGSGRVMVHDLQTGERLGATSIRGASTLAATYASSHNSMIVLSGSLSENTRRLSDMQLRVVNIEERSINTEEIDGEYSWHDILDLEIKPDEAGRYRITGINRELDVRL